MDDQDRIGIAVATVVLAVLAYLASCGTAKAIEYEIHYRNVDANRASTMLRVCQGATCQEIASPCAAGATCKAVLDLAAGTFATTALVAEAAAGSWSPPSNSLSITVPTFEAWCLALDACRFDVDASHSVTVADFGRFLKALGSAW